MDIRFQKALNDLCHSNSDPGGQRSKFNVGKSVRLILWGRHRSVRGALCVPLIAVLPAKLISEEQIIYRIAKAQLSWGHSVQWRDTTAAFIGQ